MVVKSTIYLSYVHCVPGNMLGEIAKYDDREIGTGKSKKALIIVLKAQS